MRYQPLFKNFFPFFILFLVSFWVVSPFFRSGLPNTHDGQTHVMRLASFHQALVDGQLPPRWAGNLAFGFGSPVISFAFPLPYILGEVFHRFSFSFVDSTRIVFVLGYFLSGVTMYLFLYRVVGPLSSFVGAFLYQFMPYRFLDIYVRGDVGEALVFIFPPLILYLLWENRQQIDWGRISLASLAIGAMFLTHQITAVIFSGVIFILLIVNGKIKPFIVSFWLGISLAAFNLLPLIFEKSFTNLNLLVSNNYQNQFPKLASLFYSRWNWGPAAPDNPEISMAFQLGFAQWLGVGLLVLLLILYQIKKVKVSVSVIKLSLVSLSLFLVFLFLASEYSLLLWKDIFFLPMILYPWRLLAMEVFLTAMIGSLAISLIKPFSLKMFLAIVLVGLAFYGNRNHNQVVGRTIHDDAYYLSYQGTSDMWGEFLPRGTKPPEKAPLSRVEIGQGQEETDNPEVRSNEISFKTTMEKGNLARINVFSYPDWQVLIDNQKVALIESKLLEFNVPAGKHKIDVEFTETPLRSFANYLSLLTLVSLLGFLVYKFKLRE